MDKGRREKGSAAGFTVGRFTVQRLGTGDCTQFGGQTVPIMFCKQP
jgi:hypothetical protein